MFKNTLFSKNGPLRISLTGEVFSNKIIFIILFITIIILTVLPNTALAVGHSGGVLGNIDLHGILGNLKRLLVPITQLILAISFISGIALIFRGVAMLHTFGQMQQQMNKPGGVTGPLIYICIGAVLMYMPSATTMSSATIFGSSYSTFLSGDVVTLQGYDNSNLKVNTTATYTQDASSQLMQYVNVGGGQEWSDLINTIVMFIQLVGLIAFVRGWFILSHAGGQGAQQGTFSKGLIHIVGGIIAINFIPFMQAIAVLIF